MSVDILDPSEQIEEEFVQGARTPIAKTTIASDQEAKEGVDIFDKIVAVTTNLTLEPMRQTLIRDGQKEDFVSEMQAINRGVKNWLKKFSANFLEMMGIKKKELNEYMDELDQEDYESLRLPEEDFVKEQSDIFARIVVGHWLTMLNRFLESQPQVILADHLFPSDCTSEVESQRKMLENKIDRYLISFQDCAKIMTQLGQNLTSQNQPCELPMSMVLEIMRQNTSTGLTEEYKVSRKLS